MRGRKPQSTAFRVLHGNPGRRPINTAEPQHAPLAATCPKVLTDRAARAEWKRVAPELLRTGHVTQVDRAVLIGYCCKYAQWLALEAAAAAAPFVTKTRNGYPVPNPLLGQANRAFELLLRAAAELGITPSARSRVSATPPAPPGTPPRWAGLLPFE